MNQSNTSSPRGSEVPLESPRGQWQLKSPRMKRFLKEERMGRKGVGSAIRWGGANRGSYALRNNSEEELLKRDVDPYIIRVGIKRRKRGGRKFRKR